MRCGTSPSHAASAAGAREFRIPFSQLRFRPSDTSTFGLAIVRQVGRLNETTTWPLLAKSANGYVSSFGELTGLRLDRSPKRLEIVPYVVGDVKTAAGRVRQPALEARPIRTARSVSTLKYAVRPGLTLTGTVNPDFGQVEADPGGSEPVGVRDVLLRAPAVLRGRVRHVPLRSRLQRRQLQRPVLLAPDRPIAARRGGGPRGRLLVRAGADDDPGRGEVDREGRRRSRSAR